MLDLTEILDIITVHQVKKDDILL